MKVEMIGRMHMHLVSCVGKKLTTATPAKELYVSPWFKKARQYVETNGGNWFILSAKYGLVHPDQVIEPYELTLNQMAKVDRRKWATRVFAQLLPRLSHDLSLTILAGSRYREFLEDWLISKSDQVFVPMRGLGIGKQLKWLTEAVERK